MPRVSSRAYEWSMAKMRLDARFSAAVKARDGYRCTLCGSGNLARDCAHIVSRRYGSTRWDFENATTLCRREHVHYTTHPGEWAVLCEERMGPARYEALLRRAQGHPVMDLGQWREYVALGAEGVKPW